MQTSFGQLSRTSDGYQVRFERRLPHPIEKVWDAVVNPEKVKIWFSDIELEMDFRPGGKIIFRFQDEARTETFGEILEIETPHRFVYTWEGELAIWELQPDGKSSCRLTLTYSKIALEYADKAPAGWHIVLEQLAGMLKGRTEPYPAGGGQTSIHKRIKSDYRKMAQKQFPELAPKKQPSPKPLIIERTYAASADRVWQAISDPEQMKAWYFNLPGFRPEPGYKFQFSGGPSPEKQYLHLCEVTEVVPGKKLSYSWRYDGYEGMSFVTFALFPKGDKTLLRLTHRGLHTFPVSNPDLAVSNFVAGWTGFLDKRLKAFLAGTL